MDRKIAKLLQRRELLLSEETHRTFVGLVVRLKLLVFARCEYTIGEAEHISKGRCERIIDHKSLEKLVDNSLKQSGLSKCKDFKLWQRKPQRFPKSDGNYQ